MASCSIMAQGGSATQLDDSVNAMHDTFHWLDDSGDLDLRLGFDPSPSAASSLAASPPAASPPAASPPAASPPAASPHTASPSAASPSSASPSVAKHDVAGPGERESRRKSFRRHLSISKFSLGARSPASLGRHGAKDPDHLQQHKADAAPASSASTCSGHVRSRSRALSLITPSKHTVVYEPSTAVDHAASHYQDPDARMKLRLYLASPHKFDEAIEFGFPSMDESQGHEYGTPGSQASEADASHPCSSFLQDDSSSVYSEASIADPETPKTPDAAYKTLPSRLGRASQDQSQASASSREMTLRVTLTRPDLRAGDDEIYGWQKGPRKAQLRDDAVVAPSLLPCSLEGNAKESIERQFAAFDEEALANDSGVVKRFWNRVRRT